MFLFISFPYHFVFLSYSLFPSLSHPLFPIRIPHHLIPSLFLPYLFTSLFFNVVCLLQSCLLDLSYLHNLCIAMLGPHAEGEAVPTISREGSNYRVGAHPVSEGFAGPFLRYSRTFSMVNWVYSMAHGRSWPFSGSACHVPDIYCFSRALRSEI